MIKHTKDVLMYKVSKVSEIYSEEEINQIAKIAENVSKEELINIIYKLSELENKMKWSSQKTIIFETEIIKLCMKQDTKALEERIERLEKMVSEGTREIKVNNREESKYTIQKDITDKKPKKIEEKKEEVKKEVKESVKPLKPLEKGEVISNWSNVLTNLKKQGKVMLYANLVNTEAVEINDMTVGIRFNNGLNSFRKELLQKPENMNILTKEVSMICGKPMQIKLEDSSANNKLEKPIKKENPIEEKKEDILDSLDIPINFIEE